MSFIFLGITAILGGLYLLSGPSPFLPWIGGADWFLKVIPPKGFTGIEFYLFLVLILVCWLLLKVIKIAIQKRTLAACLKPVLGLTLLVLILGTLILQGRMKLDAWHQQANWSQEQLESLPAQASLAQLQQAMEPLFTAQPRLRPALENQDLKPFAHWGYALTFSTGPLDVYEAYQINVELNQQKMNSWEIRKVKFVNELVSCEIITESPKSTPVPHPCPETVGNQD